MIEQVNDPIIEIHDLTVSYDKRPVLWNIDLSIPQGSMVGIIGPNGAGKSTLLKSIMDMLKINNGHIKLFDQDLDEVRNKISYVPQTESVEWDFPATVLDVVLMGRYNTKNLFSRISNTDKKIALQCLEKVEMQNYQDRQISQLSGGQQQRVFIARSLAQEAELYLMDEPFAGIDAASEEAIVKLLQIMHSEGKTIVAVHHDLQSAPSYFNWIILLNKRLIASAPTEKAFTKELLQNTYGGRLTLLDELEEIVAHKEIKFEAFKNKA